MTLAPSVNPCEPVLDLFLWPWLRTFEWRHFDMLSFEQNDLNILDIYEMNTVLIWCEINTRIQLSKTLCSRWSEIFHTGETFIVFEHLFSSTNNAVVMKQRNQRSSINWGEGQSSKCEWTRVLLYIYHDYIYSHGGRDIEVAFRQSCKQVEIEVENDRSWPVLKLSMLFEYFVLILQKTFSLLVIISSNKCIVPSTVSGENMVR